MSRHAPYSHESSETEFAAKADAARRAAATWRRVPVEERADLLRQVWKIVAARRDEIRAVVHEENGKPALEVDVLELGPASLLTGYFCGVAPRVLADKAPWKPWFFFNKRAVVRYRPRGVIGLITPWNLPFLIPYGDALCAMLAGNAVLLKPSEWTTRTALWLEAAIAGTGLLPEGLLSVVTGGGAVGARVIDATDMVLFTGSTKTGRVVATRAAEQLKPAVLELGGKHPMIVFADAALERAAAAALWAGCSNAGQLCVGVERVFVEAAVYDRFVELLRAKFAEIRDAETGRAADVGRLTFPPGLDRVQGQLEDARKKGARVMGGEVLDRDGLHMAPALVLDARMDMEVMTHETFGPVVPVMKVSRGEEAIALCNAGPEGLAASLWTTDLEKGEALSATVEAGMVGINEPATHYALGSMPFGGVKASGVGRRHGEEGLLMFTQSQSVLTHEFPDALPDFWWYPYKEERVAFLRRLLGLP